MGGRDMSEDQAYVDGQDAFHAGKGLDANPTSAWNGQLYDAWIIGWLDARDASLRTARKA